MNEFAGIVSFNGGPVEKHIENQVERAMAALRNGRLVAQQQAPGALFVERKTVGRGEPRPIASSNRHILFVANARLDNRVELGAALAIAPPELARLSDSVLIQRMHERWGDAGVARCLGTFVFALWDADARRLILARDCLGSRAVFFHRGRDFVAFATSLGALLALPGVPREIDEIALANFLAVNLTLTPRTFYRGIERVPSRTIIQIDRAGLTYRKYWEPNFDALPSFRRDEDYIERARELFDQAVATATADMRQVAIATSGGLDSSAIAATVARLGHAERIDCYTNVPPVGTNIDVGPTQYLNERDKVEALMRMYPTLKVQFFETKTPHPYEDDPSRFFAHANVPVLGPAVLGDVGYLYDAVAEAGHQAMLVGTAGNFGLSWPGYFSLLALLRSAHWATFARDFFALARHNRRGPAQTFAGEIVMRAAPLRLRRLIHRLRRHAPDSVARYSALNPTFIAEHDLARHWRDEGFDPWSSVGGWHPARLRAARLFDYNQVARDFRATSEEWIGYTIRDPHADRRLLEFLLTVPEPMYRRNGVPRSFARAVLADRLPPEILRERRSGMHYPAWFSSLNARRQDIAVEIERLDDSPLARRLIDLPRLKRLMNEWPVNEHAAEERKYEYRLALGRGIHIGRFIRWVERGNA